MVAVSELGGILLSGGRSSRMGRDKATLIFDGVTLATRTSDLLEQVTTTVVEVGEGASGIAAVSETPRGAGPLAAIVAGHLALLARGLDMRASCLVVACDLPRLTRSVLDTLATWPSAGSVFPIIDGMTQPLCARWSWEDLADAASAFHSGARSLRQFPDRARATLLDESIWKTQRDAFVDVDCPQDLLAPDIRGRCSSLPSVFEDASAREGGGTPGES